MLSAKTKRQQTHVESLLKDRKPLGVDESGVTIDGRISFDDMERIVDYLRSSEPNSELFEQCWVAYNRKGSKKKSLEQWKKLKDSERERVLSHIMHYATCRERKYQKDFERYLRDKTFNDVVFDGNRVLYDPVTESSDVYSPHAYNIARYNNKGTDVWLYTGFYFDGDDILDGYTEENRPDGAEIMLNNARGFLRWDKTNKRWMKK